VAVADLPAEARDTLVLIDAGGPYRYDRDGVVFENRERILPAQQRGYYREYTVPTPGEDDRGALRIVTGDVGQYYWTEDHYASFERIDR
jgi:ribonuclease T1